MTDGNIVGTGERIQLSHGSGGLMMQRLIREIFFPAFGADNDAGFDDAAEITLHDGPLAFSTDSFVVKPLFFPGGDIGSLAVSGTVNDILMKGAKPYCLSLALIIEEGFPLAELKTIVKSLADTAKIADVRIVTGDTKVVGRGEIDGLVINTSGIGEILPNASISGVNARPGDVLLVSGEVGNHGIAVMAERNGLKLKGNIASDAAPLNASVIPMLERFGESVHVLRDPTRGGVAATINEIAEASKVTVLLDESSLPVGREVEAVSELLGFDPLYLPCEGRFLAFVDGGKAESILRFLREDAGCPDATQIGTVTETSNGEVLMTTVSGGQRIIDMPAGELLPRIC